MSSNYLVKQTGENYDLYCRNINISGTYVGPNPPLPTNIQYDTLTQINGNSRVELSGNTFINNLQANDIGAQGNISSAVDLIAGGKVQSDSIVNRTAHTLSITASQPGVSPGVLNLIAAPIVGIQDGNVNMQGTISMKDNSSNEAIRITPLATGSTMFSQNLFFINSLVKLIFDSQLITSTNILCLVPSSTASYATSTGVPTTNVTMTASELFISAIGCVNIDNPTARVLNIVLPNASDIDAHYSAISGGAPGVGFSLSKTIFDNTMISTGSASTLTITVSNSADGTVVVRTGSALSQIFTLNICKCQTSSAGIISYYADFI